MQATTAAVEVARGVWRVTTPMPGRPSSVHAYLAARDDGGFLLVDGGLDSDVAWAALDGGVHAAACGWGAVAGHVVTHMHRDHVGLARRVRQQSGAPLVMGRLDAERAAGALRAPDGEARYRADVMRRGGVPGSLRREAEAARAGDGLGGFVPPDTLFDGESAPLSFAPEWEILSTPGHTAGHVSLYRARDGVLIGGDAVLPRVTSTIGVNRQRTDPVGDYLATLDRLERLGPALVLPGHGDALHEPRARIAELRDATRAEGRVLLSALADGPATAWELACRRYAGRELPLSMQLHALRETLAHLDHLHAAGAIRVEEHEDGAARFELRA